MRRLELRTFSQSVGPAMALPARAVETRSGRRVPECSSTNEFHHAPQHSSTAPLRGILPSPNGSGRTNRPGGCAVEAPAEDTALEELYPESRRPPRECYSGFPTVRPGKVP